jgi:DNA polymerase alpha subunit B
MLPTTPARGSAVKRKFPAAHETPRGGISSRMHLDNQSSPIAASSPLQTPHKPPPAFSLASLEAVTPFSKRTNAGETVEVLNPHLPQPTLPSADATSESRVSFIFRMDLKSFAYRPMYQKLTEASEALDERIDEFAAAIQEHYSLPDEAFGDASVASPAETVAVGRIVSDSPEGKFNASSVCLESSRMAGGGVRTPLKLDRIASFSFFPGQIVAVKGVNSSGGYFQVHEVLEPPKLPPAATSTAELAATAQKGPVTVFIASGPYTTQDNLAFEALDELCNKAAELQPDVVILTGPFIDSAHPLVQAGDFELEDDEGTLEDLFRQQISRKINRIKNSMVLLIPSVRDAVSKHCAFPQDRLNRKFLGLGDVYDPLDPSPSTRPC